jgi:hypothetical protein
MAEHGHIGFATAEGNDLPAHEAMYERFVHLVLIFGALITNVVLGLAIGSVQGHWLTAFAIFVVATMVAFHGFVTGARAPSVTMVFVSLLALALSAGGS